MPCVTSWLFLTGTVAEVAEGWNRTTHFPLAASRHLFGLLSLLYIVQWGIKFARNLFRLLLKRPRSTMTSDPQYEYSPLTEADGIRLIALRPSQDATMLLHYTIDQGSPCPLATLNPFGRELLLSDVSTGFKRSTWIQRILWSWTWLTMTMTMNMNMTMRVM